jgi:glutathione S-transferase
MLAAASVDWKAYVKLIGDRPSAQRVVADRKAAEAAMAAAAAASKGA